MSDLFYREKYWKYKNKYLDAQYGGSKRDIFLLYIVGCEETKASGKRDYMCTLSRQLNMYINQQHIARDRIHVIYGSAQGNQPTCQPLPEVELSLVFKNSDMVTYVEESTDVSIDD